MTVLHTCVVTFGHEFAFILLWRKTNNNAKYWPPKPRVCDLNCLYHIKIWMICRQQCCRDDHRISKKPRTTSDACLSLPLALEIYWDITVTPFLSVNRNPGLYCWLTHWGRVTHICVSQLTIIGSDNGLSPGRHQAIIWTNDGILLIGPLGTNISEILSEIHTFSFKKMHFKTSSAKWRPFCLGLNVLNTIQASITYVLRTWWCNLLYMQW